MALDGSSRRCTVLALLARTAVSAGVDERAGQSSRGS